MIYNIYMTNIIILIFSLLGGFIPIALIVLIIYLINLMLDKKKEIQFKSDQYLADIHKIAENVDKNSA